MALSLAITGVILLVLSAGGMGGSDEEKRLWRDSWRRSNEISSADRMSRQRMFIMDRAKYILLPCGVVMIFAAIVLAIVG